MREPLFKTRITELLGIRHPILCGGMGPGVSDARYVAAVVNAGGMGFIMALGWSDPEEFRAELRKCRELTGGKPFGVNLYISRQAGGIQRAEQQVRVLCEESVACVETAGASPEPVIPILREAGIKILHKVPAVRYAFTAQRLGVDAVIIVGAECGGHPGVYQIGSMVQAAHGPEALDIPVVIGGGIGTGRQIAAVLAMGAEGVTIGSRMIVAEELWIHRKYKEFVAAADGTESIVVKTAIRDHHRVYHNESARAVAELDSQKVTDFERYRPHVMGTLAREAYRTGDPSKGMLDFGPAVVFANQIESVEAIFDRLIDDARESLTRLQRLRLDPSACAVGNTSASTSPRPGYLQHKSGTSL
jgi:NAD(P)H-dependent flavin oxidoreductase YrpB (nitropropane dioxygenase family)